MSTRRGQVWILTCEHGGNEVPPGWAQHFVGAEDVLASHRGWDPGALALLRHLAPLADATFHATVTRLLVDLNRSERHPRVFSEFTRGLPSSMRTELLDRYWRPYRDQVADAVAAALVEHETVLHLGVHTFTPVLDGEVRDVDIGVLYDPQRPVERDWCRSWAAALAEGGPLRVRLNRPYRGAADGLTTAFRRRFGPRYLGVELEVNQALLVRGRWDARVPALLEETLSALRPR